MSEADKPTNGDQEAEKTGVEPQNPKVLSSITKVLLDKLEPPCGRFRLS